jgi:hypothetical protein
VVIAEGTVVGVALGGTAVGVLVGGFIKEGNTVGDLDLVGDLVRGALVGRFVGVLEGEGVGILVGLRVGILVGFLEERIGTFEGQYTGLLLGLRTGPFVTLIVGNLVGTAVFGALVADTSTSANFRVESRKKFIGVYVATKGLKRLIMEGGE